MIRKIHLHVDLSQYPPVDETCIMPDTSWDLSTVKNGPLYLYFSVQDTGSVSSGKDPHGMATADR